MIYFLYTIFFVSCVMLIVSVLLQPGKTDAGALFTSNISSGALGPRGTQTVLSKITIVAAVVFMLSALFISMPALQGGVSVLNANPDAPAATDTTTQPPISDVGNSANTGTTAPPENVSITAPAGNTAPAANTAAANASTNANQ